MSKRFRDLGSMVTALRTAGVSQARVTCKVATTTLAGGERLIFRGRVCVSADTGTEQLEYEQEISRRAVEVATDVLPVTPEHADSLQRAQLDLMRQIRLYREWYQSLVSEARETVTDTLTRAGIAPAEE